MHPDDAESVTRGIGKPFLTSSEVVERLGISKATLYAYVSRGLIRSEPVPEAPRTRRYRTDDVERLLQRQRMRGDPEITSATVLDWGFPVLESEVSVVSDERLYYRGHDAVRLARQRSTEQVATLLWLDDISGELPNPSDTATTIRRQVIQQLQPSLANLDTLGRIQVLLPILERHEPAMFDVRPETTMRIGTDILQLFLNVLVGAEGRSGISRTLQVYWAPGQSDYVRLLDAALILSADHELNISTFTVRCIASSGAPLHSAIAGGLAALRGHRHGGAILQAEAMAHEVKYPESAYDVLLSRLQRGDPLAGFGHRLYPGGDPRAATILDLLRENMPDSSAVQLGSAIADAAFELRGEQPNIDFALVVLSRAMNLPRGSGLVLMALGRTIGWIAHAREEYDRNRLIHPRGRYSGRPPGSHT